MTSSVHGDWLQRFKDDLRTGDVESLTGNVETAGLEIILDSEFYELACQEDARQVVILIGTLGEENKKDRRSYTRMRASYQYLVGQIEIDVASKECAVNNKKCKEFYKSLLESSRKKTKINFEQKFITADDLRFGIEFSVNTGNILALLPLLECWMRIDKSGIPWLRACRSVVKKGEKCEIKLEISNLATVSEELIRLAPDGQNKVTQEMRVQFASFAYKSKNGEKSCKAALEAYNFDKNDERLFDFIKALILNNQYSAAKEQLQILLLKLLSNKNLVYGEVDKVNKENKFDVLKAEDALIDINHVLKESGLKPFLLSGTLLGYAREGSIMSHDKDLDIGIIGWENQFKIAESLLRAGCYKLDFSQLNGCNQFLMSAYDLRHNVSVDIFLLHEKEDHFLHGIDFDMNFTQNFKFSKFELREVEFLGDLFYVPANIDLNLTENYGNWQMPLPSYVVTVESPALCDMSDSRVLLIYIEILKTITKKMNPQRVIRIVDYLDLTQNKILDVDICKKLRMWCAQSLSNAQAKEVLM